MPVSVDVLCSRLRSLPDAFRTVTGAKGEPELSALIADTLMHISNRLPEAKTIRQYRWMKSTAKDKHKTNFFKILYVVTWLFYDPLFQNICGDPQKGHQQFFEMLEFQIKRLSELVDASAFVEDADRREELVRICLNAMGVSIEGELESHSADRLQELDSVARHQLILEAKHRRKVEAERKRKIAEEKRKKREEEQAARYGREW